MENVLAAAQQINDELLEIRRTIHQFPEIGEKLPKTKAFVINKLTEYGYTPNEICESGIVAVLQGAKKGKTIMLRADMDALKIEEKSNFPFASKNTNMHACGHDMHTAMLLGAAKLLKRYETGINGNIKFVFQPNEEGFEGAKAMLRAGVLDSPRVDAAMALHVASGSPSGTIMYTKGTFMAGCTFFRITIKGKGCHGAMPNTGVDPITTAAHIHLALQEIITRELSPAVSVTLTIGKIRAGESANVIPEEAVMEGSIRTHDSDTGKFIYKRICEISRHIACSFRAEAFVEEICAVPPLINDPKLTEEMAKYINEIYDTQKVIQLASPGTGSEDFSVYTHKIPCSYFIIGAGTAQEGKDFGKPMHSESVVFNEDILPLGCGIFAQCALRWLQSNRN